MDNLTVLVTGAGAPGITGILYSLKNNFDDRKIRTIGVDIRSNVIGEFECDGFYKIPPPEDGEFLPALLDICERESVAVILPQVTRELPVYSGHKKEFAEVGTRIAISDKDAIALANNKHELLKLSAVLGLPTASFRLVSDRDGLRKAAFELGYPEKKVVVKPPVSNGMRGLRILGENLDRKKWFYEQKPTSLFTTLTELEQIIGDTFPELIVMEHLPGDEYSVDILRKPGNSDLVIVPRLREQIRSGITFGGKVIKEPNIIENSSKLATAADLTYAFGFQFKMDHENNPAILESNPRIQGSMVMATFANANIIYGAVKCALGEELPELVPAWGKCMLRYWGAVGLTDGRIGDRF